MPRSCNGWPSSISTFRTCDSTAIAIDVGDQDNLKVDTGKLHDVLTNYGVKHDFEIYPGTHTSHVAVRFQENVMPFFSRTLSSETAKR